MTKKRRAKRRRMRFHRRTQPGASPGVVETHPDSPRPIVRLMAYNADELVEQEIANLEELPDYVRNYDVTWINVDGLGDAKTIKRLGELFGLHSLALEDVVNIHQRAKVEVYDSQLFIVTRMARETEQVETEQLSLFLGKNYVLTFQNLPGDCLDPVRRRIRRAAGEIRGRNADFLAYSLIDAVVDSYFPVVERLADHLDRLEEQLVVDPSQSLNTQIHDVKSDLLFLRRSVQPHRDAINGLIRDGHALIGDETRVYLRDCADHTSQLIDLLEVYREMAISLRDYYASMVGNRMNEIMTVLTIISTIFIPLSFIAGVYGMNFDTRLPGNMPELHWPYGYVMVLALMLAIAGSLVLFFRRKGWLGSSRPPNK